MAFTTRRARQYSGRSHQFLGDQSERDPPVPIPNTEVKPLSPDGTARASVWESRTSPGLIQEARPPRPGFFAFMPALTVVRGARQLLTLRGPAGPRRGSAL